MNDYTKSAEKGWPVGHGSTVPDTMTKKTTKTNVKIQKN